MAVCYVDNLLTSAVSLLCQFVRITHLGWVLTGRLLLPVQIARQQTRPAGHHGAPRANCLFTHLEIVHARCLCVYITCWRYLSAAVPPSLMAVWSASSWVPCLYSCIYWSALLVSVCQLTSSCVDGILKVAARQVVRPVVPPPTSVWNTWSWCSACASKWWYM